MYYTCNIVWFSARHNSNVIMTIFHYRHLTQCSECNGTWQ